MTFIISAVLAKLMNIFKNRIKTLSGLEVCYQFKTNVFVLMISEVSYYAIKSII